MGPVGSVSPYQAMDKQNHRQSDEKYPAKSL